MLTPLQSSRSAAIVSTMQSIIEAADDRAREQADKASGRDRNEGRQAGLQSDEASRRASAKVNEHFFGTNARSGDTLAKLISRFSDTLGVAQQEGESARAFAQRLTDRLALADGIRISDNDAAGQITLARLGTTLGAVKAAIAGDETDDAAAELVARLAAETGTTQGTGGADEDFAARLADMLTNLRGQLPDSKKALEESSGLADLGLSAEELIAAIRSPYGSEAERVKDALADKALAEKTLTPEMQKVLARLEDVANPKSIEELKLERTRRDPTRIDDADTRAEREETIQALEAGEKLEDARDLQRALSEAHETVVKGKDLPDTRGNAVDALETIQLLSTGVTPTAPGSALVTVPIAETGLSVVESAREALRVLDQAQAAEEEERENAKKAIFVLRVDDNGLYDLITRQTPSIW